MNRRICAVAVLTLGMTFGLGQTAHAGYNNGGDGRGLCCDDTPPTTGPDQPVVVSPVVTPAPVTTTPAPVASIPAAAPAVATPAVATPAAATPAAATPAVAEPGLVKVLSETVANAPAAAVLTAAVPAAATSSGVISFTGANSLAMAVVAAGLLGLGVAMVMMSRRRTTGLTVR